MDHIEAYRSRQRGARTFGAIGDPHIEPIDLSDLPCMLIH